MSKGKSIFFIFLAFTTSLTLFSITSCSSGKKEEAEKEIRTRKATKYHCPMHPTYISDKPGECPICGMTLVPIEEEKGKEKYPPGTVSLTPYKEQLIGVKYSKVSYVPLKKEIRTVGRVEYDETRLYRVNLKISGWITKLYVNYTGKFVKKGEPLFRIYSPELLSTQEEYLISYRNYQKVKNNPFLREDAERALKDAKNRLILWDVEGWQIKELEKSGKTSPEMTIYSKYSGFVIKKNVIEGGYAKAGSNLFEIADISKIWVLADIYEYEADFVDLGQDVEIVLPYLEGQRFDGKISYIYPYLETKTRTIKVRIIVDNPDFYLKPGMYAKAVIKIDLGERLAVPVDAVMRTGKKNIVFVKVKEGKLVPREIKTGPQVGDYFIVLSGVEEGEEIVTSANFLIDSESKLKLAIEAMGGKSSSGHSGHGAH